MRILKLIFKNALRHKLRTILTVVGISIAVIAFGLLRTVVTAWNSGVEASAANRLITRQAISFIFPLALFFIFLVCKKTRRRASYSTQYVCVACLDQSRTATTFLRTKLLGLSVGCLQRFI